MRIGRRLQLNNLSSKRIIGVLTLAAVTSLACASAQTGPADSTDTTEPSDPGSSGYIAIPAQPRESGTRVECADEDSATR